MLLSIALNEQVYLPEPPLAEGLCSSFSPGSGGLESGQSGYSLFRFLGGTLRAADPDWRPNISIPWEPVGNANAQAHLRLTE